LAASTAATLPDRRGKGVRTALVRHRIAVVAESASDVVAGHAAVGSGSQRTMERCGLKVAYTKAIWTQLPLASDRGAPGKSGWRRSAAETSSHCSSRTRAARSLR
jgi:hypothetical protein